MLNAIRMDVYKMFHMKSFWVILLIMAAMIYLSTTIVKTDIRTESTGREEMDADDANTNPLSFEIQKADESDTNQPSFEIQKTNDETSPSLGIQLDDSGITMENVLVDQLLFEDIQSMLAALFMVIFTVLFSFSDLKNGYIKNIGGQVKHRSILIASKAIVLFLYTFIYMICLAVVQTISCHLIFGYVRWNDLNQFLTYMGVQIMLHFALLLICMTVTMVIRNNVFSMTFVICLCLGVMNLVYLLMNRAIQKYINADFDTFSHTVTGKIAMLPLDCTSGEVGSAVLVAILFAIIMLVINVYNIEKRDVV